MKKQILVLIGCTLMLLLIFIGTNLNSNRHAVTLEPMTAHNSEQAQEESVILEVKEPIKYMVDIKGEVRYPGVYEIGANARVHDVIMLAGGLTELAWDRHVNLAQRVSDEMVIHIPSINDDLSELPLLAAAVAPSGSQSQKVSLNSATLEELQTLPGIGQVRAAAIISHREEFGNFTSIDDLIKVNGIGNATLQNLRDQIEL